MRRSERRAAHLPHQQHTQRTNITAKDNSKLAPRARMQALIPHAQQQRKSPHARFKDSCRPGQEKGFFVGKKFGRHAALSHGSAAKKHSTQKGPLQFSWPPIVVILLRCHIASKVSANACVFLFSVC